MLSRGIIITTPQDLAHADDHANNCLQALITLADSLPERGLIDLDCWLTPNAKCSEEGIMKCRSERGPSGPSGTSFLICENTKVLADRQDNLGDHGAKENTQYGVHHLGLLPQQLLVMTISCRSGTIIPSLSFRQGRKEHEGGRVL